MTLQNFSTSYVLISSLSHPHKAELVSPFHNPQVTPKCPVYHLSFFPPKRIRTLTASASVLRRRFTSFSTSGDSIYWARERKENRDTVKCLVHAAGVCQLQPSTSISSLSSLMLSAQPVLMFTLKVVYAPLESNPSFLYRAPWKVVHSHFSTFTTYKIRLSVFMQKVLEVLFPDGWSTQLLPISLKRSFHFSLLN